VLLVASITALSSCIAKLDLNMDLKLTRLEGMAPETAALPAPRSRRVRSVAQRSAATHVCVGSSATAASAGQRLRARPRAAAGTRAVS
jgi:hypothetical protein